MRFLHNILNKIPKRTYANIHDVKIVGARLGPNGNWIANNKEEAKGFKGTQPEKEQVSGTMERNVFQKPLALHSTRPLTGFLRTGYCEAPKSDFGNHSVAAVVSDEFLDFSAARGNDLRQAGLTGGCKWCLCVSRWREAFEARKGDADVLVPKVVLKATNERALEGVKMEDLKRFAVDKDEP